MLPNSVHMTLTLAQSTLGAKRLFQGEAALAARDLNSRRACTVRLNHYWLLLGAHKSQFQQIEEGKLLIRSDSTNEPMEGRGDVATACKAEHAHGATFCFRHVIGAIVARRRMRRSKPAFICLRLFPRDARSSLCNLVGWQCIIRFNHTKGVNSKGNTQQTHLSSRLDRICRQIGF